MTYDGKLDLAKAAINILNLEKTYFDALIHVDSPPGSGLGSSSAVAVSLIGSLSHLSRKNLSTYEIAEKAYDVERSELGIKGGKQDQYASSFGGFNLLEFKRSSVDVTPLRIRREVLNELLASIVVCDTQVTRLSANILERQSESYSRGSNAVDSNLDFIKKSTYDMKAYLIKGDMKSMGELLHEGWTYKKKLDSEISNPSIDRIYDAALENGASGGKLLGAGGGGHFLLICDPDKREEVSHAVEKMGCKQIKINFDTEGLQVWKKDNDRIMY